MPDPERDVVKPIEAVKSATAGPPLQTDIWVYRMVVFSLGLTVLLALIGGIILAILLRDILQVLIALGSGAIGALAGLLVPSSHNTQKEK
jgi:hypothetical protein